MPTDKNNPKIVKGKAWTKDGRKKGQVSKATKLEQSIRKQLDNKGYCIVSQLIMAIEKIQDPRQKAEMLLRLLPFAYNKLADAPYQPDQTIDTQAEAFDEISTEDLLKLANNDK